MFLKTIKNLLTNKKEQILIYLLFFIKYKLNEKSTIRLFTMI